MCPQYGEEEAAFDADLLAALLTPLISDLDWSCWLCSVMDHSATPGVQQSTFSSPTMPSSAPPAQDEYNLMFLNPSIPRVDTGRATAASHEVNKLKPQVASDVDINCSRCPPHQWITDDVLNWVYSVAGRLGIDGQIHGEHFQSVTGEQLCVMTPAHFERLGKGFGTLFYHELCQLLNTGLTEIHQSTSEVIDRDASYDDIISDATTTASADSLGYKPSYYPVEHLPCYYTAASYTSATATKTDTASTATLTQFEAEDKKGVITEASAVIRKPGRPRKTTRACKDTETTKMCKKRGRKKGQLSKGYHLWEFLRDLLLDPSQPCDVIRWEDRDSGVFRIVDSKAVSSLWGKQKKNHKMTYEKLSRAIRFCQEKSVGYFSRLPEDSTFPKKLCFKFGPKTSGWQAGSPCRNLTPSLQGTCQPMETEEY